MTRDQEKFIKQYVKHLFDGDAAIFAGAGFSAGAGFVNWRELLREIADDLDLDIDKETDLISIAQYHTNAHGRNKINQKILNEFSHHAQETESHRIVARLPINTIWTTNYDKLIEESFKKIGKRPDVKYTVPQLSLSLAKKDVTVYKMHGDVEHATDAVITKYDYEKYHITHQPFITALSSDLITKTFLFIGFSFTDPNLDQILSRVRINFGENFKNHYCIIRKIKLGDKGSETQAEYDYNTRKQNLMLHELARFHIQPILVDEYSEITAILAEIEKQYKQKTVFISGSAVEYGTYSQHEAIGFIHKLSSRLIRQNYTIVNGFGWGIGSAVINGALEAIYTEPLKFSETQLIMRPFPQFQTGEKSLAELWQEYREKMIKYAGIAIILFGNKKEHEEVINAPGVMKEFEIAEQQGLFILPVAATGYQAKVIWELIRERYTTLDGTILKELELLEKEDAPLDSVIDSIMSILSFINK